VCIGLHVRQQHGLPTGSKEYAAVVADSKATTASSSSSSTTPTLGDVMPAFVTPLRSFADGEKTDVVAKQHRRNVERMLLDILEGDEYSPDKLRRLLTIDRQPDGLLARMLKKYAAGSVGVYLTSLIHFVQFLKVNVEYLTGFCQPADLVRYQSLFEGCQKAMNRRRLKEDQEKHVRLSESYTSPAVLGRFVNGVWETPGDFASNADYVPSPDQFACVRDCLMLTVELENARRTGDLINLTVNEFRRAKASADNADDHVVHVFEHKTVSSATCAVNFFGRHVRPGLHLRTGIQRRVPRWHRAHVPAPFDDDESYQRRGK
jgi:hypothetical protein